MTSRSSVTAAGAARDRGLERALIANLLVHVLAMLGMALFLLAALIARVHRGRRARGAGVR